jgi:hydrogenase maturation protein HypF
MLPTTPVHHLLLAEVGRPLVMTSGNRSDEPIAIDDDDARERLGAIADVFLAHDRRIACRFDDSVATVCAGGPVLLRRARGYAPLPVTVPVTVTPTLGLGAELHHAFCLAAGADAFVSPHIGDLDTDEAIEALRTSLAHHRRLLRIDPEVVAHDLHPDLATTHLAAEMDLPRVPVQHHHAHMVAVMAEHGLRDPALGIVFDGFGLGADGTGWGGEWLVGGWGSVERVAHLRPVAQPGGDAAVRHPARMALAHALDAGRFAQAVDVLGIASREPAACLGGATPAQVAAQVRAGLASPATSSAGRLFDVVAALTGTCARVTHDGQPAMLLEQCALGADSEVAGRVAYPVVTTGAGLATGPLVVDTRALVAAVLDDLDAGTPPAVVAWRFHRWLATAVVEVGAEVASLHGVADVCLGGGVFANGLLTDAVHAGFGARGLRVHLARAVPPGDGGLALGQVLVAHARVASGER